MMNYKFRFIVKMINGKEYEIITNFHKEKDVLEYIDSHDYIDLFDKKIKRTVAVKSSYVISVLYKDSQKINSEADTSRVDSEDCLKEENKKLKEANKKLKQDYKQKIDDMKSLADESQTLRVRLNQTKQHNSDINNKLRNSNIRSLEFSRKYLKLERENSILKEKNKKLQDKNALLKEANEYLKEKIDTPHTSRLIAENNRLNEICIYWEKQYNELKQEFEYKERD